MNKEQAIKMLGQYAFNSRTGHELSSRINRLISFADEQKSNQISVEINNNWSVCPEPRSAKAARKLGGTTYAYQVWAVAR